MSLVSHRQSDWGDIFIIIDIRMHTSSTRRILGYDTEISLKVNGWVVVLVSNKITSSTACAVIASHTVQSSYTCYQHIHTFYLYEERAGPFLQGLVGYKAVHKEETLLLLITLCS